MRDVLLFSQKNEYENTGDDKRDYCNDSVGRRIIPLRAFSAAFGIDGASSPLLSLAREVSAKLWVLCGFRKDAACTSYPC